MTTDYPNYWQTEALSSNILSTDFDSKANGTTVTLASILDNSDELYTTVSFELVLGSITPAANGYITMELFASIDGTNYVDIVAYQTMYSRQRTLLSGASVKRVGFTFDNLLPFKYKITLLNGSGVTTAASGNALKYKRIRERGVGP
jgi:hypothetical protein